MTLSTWDIVPALRPDEDVFCTSRLWLREGSGYYVGASVGCIYDAAHDRAIGDKRHCHGDARWTDAMAAQSLAEALAALPAGRLCTDCGIRPAAGLCGVCRNATDRDENRETESENAA
jgi:hypothetical protein